MDSARSPQSSRLESWKEIARHLNRTVRTVQRWEREQGLPIHRLQHNKQATIFAFAHELDAWWQSRGTALERDALTEAAASTPIGPARSVSIRAAVVALSAVVLIAALGLGVDRFGKPTESDQLYARGRQQWNERTPESFREALSLFSRSIAADASNARAYAGLADTYALLEAFGDMSRSEALPKARAAAAKAVQLGDALGEPHASLSFVLWAEGDRAGAFREVERAIAIDPRYATAFHWYSLYLQDSARYAEAVTAATRAHDLAPDSKVIASDLAIVLRNAGRTDESTAALERLVAAHPGYAEAYLQLGEAYRLAQRYDKAAQQLTLAMQHGDARPATQARRAWLFAQSGDVRLAVDTLKRFKLMSQQGHYVPPLALLEAVTAAGDMDLAFTIIEQAVRDNQSWVTGVAGGPIFQPLTSDPRWEGLRRRIVAVTTVPDRDALKAVAAPK